MKKILAIENIDRIFTAVLCALAALLWGVREREMMYLASDTLGWGMLGFWGMIFAVASLGLLVWAGTAAQTPKFLIMPVCIYAMATVAYISLGLGVVAPLLGCAPWVVLLLRLLGVLKKERQKPVLIVLAVCAIAAFIFGGFASGLLQLLRAAAIVCALESVTAGRSDR
ncbi:MAG: hypothetical protein LBN99_00590 [Oscillospiraceae bacterium]|jgi:hypothetical protein|nr:hypothetical protein [Oscillospiraceae bacterium]